jgi:hypothetical protein
VLDYGLLLMLSVLLGVGFSLSRGCAEVYSPGVGREITCGPQCSPVSSVDSHKQVWNQMVEEMTWHRKPFHWLGVLLIDSD